GASGQNCQTCAVSQTQAAEMMNVGRRSVQKARVVRSKGVAALQRAVEAGDLSISIAAEIAQQPEEEQMRLVANGRARAVANGGARAIAAAPAKVRSNHKIQLPPGATPEKITRSGLEMEDGQERPNTAEIARTLGIADGSYRKMRAIVLLADRPDLSPTDAKVARNALRTLNETCSALQPYEAISHIAEKCWGDAKGRRTDSAITKRT